LKDLWGFNEEQVVRAIHASPVPVVSAVGHEIDVTLADLVADVRALTPSEAGERLVPDADEIELRLHTFARRMLSLLRASHAHARSRLSALANNRLFRDPTLMLRDHDRLLDDLHQRSSRAVVQRIERQRSLIETYASQLESLNPLQVLARGYSLTQRADGTIVRAATDVLPNDQIHVRLAHGKLSAIVDKVTADDG